MEQQLQDDSEIPLLRIYQEKKEKKTLTQKDNVPMAQK